MASYKYSYQGDLKEVAVSHGTNLSISLKKAVEAAREVQGKRVSSALKFLDAVSEEKAVVPYKKYRAEMAHRRGKGIATGGYPVKVAKEFTRLIKSAQSNAKEKELGEDLRVKSISVRKGAGRYHPGRYMGRKMKSTTVEVVLAPSKAKKKSAAKKEVVNK